MISEFAAPFFYMFHPFFQFESSSLLVMSGLYITFLTMVIVNYARRYLAGESRYVGFFFLLANFYLGMMIGNFAANLTTFFLGWELVGFTSFFLIGFYRENPRSLENSLVALAYYKFCDLFFMIAILGSESGMGSGWVGLLLIIGTLSKSAVFPFSTWLYKALEGPTPSSSIFYGGLALHLGPWCLIKFMPLWMDVPELRILLCALGTLTALYGFLVGITRSDLKTSLGFASISQIGLIYIELGLGWTNLAAWHIAGHILLRTWNYLRMMSFFSEFGSLRRVPFALKDLTPIFSLLPRSLYYHSLNKFYLDHILRYVFKRFLMVAWVLSTVAVMSSLDSRTFIDAIHSCLIYLAWSILALGIEKDYWSHRGIFFVTRGSFPGRGMAILSVASLLLVAFAFFIHDFRDPFADTFGILFCLCALLLRSGKSFEYQAALVLIVTGAPWSPQFFLEDHFLVHFWLHSKIDCLMLLGVMSINTILLFQSVFASVGEQSEGVSR